MCEKKKVMELGNLWLIPLSILFNSSLYWVQKHYLIKWFCRTFLTDSVQLECDLKKKQPSGGSTANGVVANGHAGPAEPAGTYQGKKIVTDGEVNGVAME